MKKKILATLVAFAVCFLSPPISLAEGPGGPNEGACPPGTDCERTQAELLQTQDGLNRCRASLVACEDERALSRRLNALEKRLKEAKPAELVCGFATHRVDHGKDRYSCECLSAWAEKGFNVKLDLLEGNRRTVACVSSVDYEALIESVKSELVVLIEQKADKAKLASLYGYLDKLRDHVVDYQKWILWIRERLGEHKQRLDDLEDHLGENGMELFFGPHLLAGYRSNAYAGGGATLGLYGRFSEAWGLSVRGRGAVIGQASSDWLINMGVSAGPTVDFDREGKFRFRFGLAANQFLRSARSGGGIEGNGFGYSLGGEVGMDFVLPPVILDVSFEGAYGPAIGWNSDMIPFRDSVFQPKLTFGVYWDVGVRKFVSRERPTGSAYRPEELREIPKAPKNPFEETRDE